MGGGVCLIAHSILNPFFYCPVVDWPTGKPGNFPVRPFGFAAWRPHKDNRQIQNKCIKYYKL